eukprot:TRINITY_DN59466_c0_g1_i1.p1 TRINITY_DN59466_c0_g1~~TRINITY_DN59466_c0_g1_i1.p1  ORF type:complete len:451 (+),score=16.99 TRINITY_DN59466_c0_g1_i1:39-1391(+)
MVSTFGVVVLGLISVGLAVGAWLWIGFRRSTRTSADGRGGAEQEIGLNQQPLNPKFRRSLEGRIIWLVLLLVAVGILYVVILLKAPEHFREITIGYICCWLSSAAFLSYVWVRVGKPNGVSGGLVANFFLTGGLLGTSCAMMGNSLLAVMWDRMSPQCNMETIMWTPACKFAAAVMWVCTPGLIEETSKSVWLFFRLRKEPSDVPRSCCFCLPSFRRYDCGCWFKLAGTPYHVMMCALASGAGFSCIENLLYVFGKSGVFAGYLTPWVTSLFVHGTNWLHYDVATVTPTPEEKAWSVLIFTAYARVVTSGMHMAWTGLIGYGLAKRMFLSESERPRLLEIVLPSMLAHGLMDYSLSAMGTAGKLKLPLDVFVFFLLLLSVTIGSCLALGSFTGCSGKCFCWDSCCFSPGFWEWRFPNATARPSQTAQASSMVGPAISLTPMSPRGESATS